MRRLETIIAASLVLAACSGGGDAPEEAGNAVAEAPPADAPSASAPPPGQDQPDKPPLAAQRWDLQATSDGITLALFPAPDKAAIRLFCPVRPNVLLVNVPGFRPVGSEERLSFGGGGNAVALVADTRGDRQRGGVSGTGEVPTNLAALIGGPISASYGSQVSGPHPAPPADLAQRFAAACYKRLSVPEGPAGTAGPSAAGACHMQGSERLAVAPLRAVGTEPFWGARIEGRCVTYSHPENQSGTRVWTRYTAGPGGGGTWVGALNDRRFELRARPRPGCSDGMSDNRYPLAVDLLVDGERRSGCARPL